MTKKHDQTDETLTIVFEGAGTSAEMEAQAVHGLLESNGIESMLVRENVTELPVGKVEVRVVASEARHAQEVIREGKQAGPSAADEAEAESEI
jgi:metal-sulfur cluster biosynthetic enzyme